MERTHTKNGSGKEEKRIVAGSVGGGKDAVGGGADLGRELFSKRPKTGRRRSRRSENKLLIAAKGLGRIRSGEKIKGRGGSFQRNDVQAPGPEEKGGRASERTGRKNGGKRRLSESKSETPFTKSNY